MCTALQFSKGNQEALKSLSRKEKPNRTSAYKSEDFMNHRHWYFANSLFFCKIFFQVDVTAQDRKWSMKKRVWW
jgi:hypothetical protein